MVEEDKGGIWTARIALAGGALLGVGRFVRYVDVVSGSDVGVASTIVWWGAFLVGAGLVAGSAPSIIDDERIDDQTLAMLLVGLIVLVVMPAFPTPAFDLGNMFGS